jgi:hypothetical protein
LNQTLWKVILFMCFCIGEWMKTNKLKIVMHTVIDWYNFFMKVWVEKYNLHTTHLISLSGRMFQWCALWILAFPNLTLLHSFKLYLSWLLRCVIHCKWNIFLIPTLFPVKQVEHSATVEFAEGLLRYLEKRIHNFSTKYCYGDSEPAN